MAKRFDGYAEVQVDGRNVGTVTEAFRLFPEVGLRPLVERGIGRREANGQISVDATGWYPMVAWLESMYEIMDRVGPAKLAEIGSRIPEIAQFPPGIDSLPAALASLDAAYHLNHRLNGRIMFDVVTGTITEGIGHYACTLNEEARSAKMVFDSPYPCDFDRGILLGMGKRFARRVSIEHGAGCRIEGAAQCRYSLRW